MRVANLLSKYSRGQKTLEDLNISLFSKESDKNIANIDKNKINTELFNNFRNKILSTIKAERDDNSPIISIQDAYQLFKDAAEDYDTNAGLKAVAFHLKSKWQGNPTGYLSTNDINNLKKYAETILPKSLFSKSSTIVNDTFSTILKQSIKNRFEISKLDKVAEFVNTQEEYDTAIELAGFSLDRPDMEEIRNYIAFRVNSKLGKHVVSSVSFTSTEKAKKIAKRLRGSINDFDVDSLSNIMSEDWRPAKKVSKTIVEDLTKEHKVARVEDALASSDVVQCVSPRDGNTYIVRKSVLDKYSLYVKRTANKDAILLDTYNSIEDLSFNVKSLPKNWVTY